MPNLDLNDVSPGAQIRSADINDNNTLLETLVNGGLDDVNFGAGAPAVVAATVGGLGAVRAGKMGLLRVGSSPFDMIGLVYDATYGKWVSEPLLLMHQQEQETSITTTSYVDRNASNFSRAVIPNFKSIYDAGLRPQIHVSANLDNSGANNTFLNVRLVTFADNDTGTLHVWEGGEISNSGTTARYKMSGWVQPVGAPTEAHALLIFRAKVAAGTGEINESTCWLRWVSA